MMGQIKLCTVMLILVLATPALGGCRAAPPEARSSPTVGRERTVEPAAPNSASGLPVTQPPAQTTAPPASEQAPGQEAYPGVVASGSAPVLGGAAEPLAISPVEDAAEPVRVAEVIEELIDWNDSCGKLLVLENPNPDLAIQNIQYRLTSYDSGGAVLNTDESRIDVLYPGERRKVYLGMRSQEGATPARLELTILGQGEPGQTSLAAESLGVERVHYWPESGAVTAIATNRTDFLMRMPGLTALLYDQQDRLIGDGQEAYNGFIPPRGQAGVSLHVPYRLDAARVELLAVPHGGWLTGPVLRDRPTLQAGQLVIGRDAYDDKRVNAVFSVANPNTDRGVGVLDYQITAFDAQGLVLGTQTGLTPIVFPGEEVAVIASRFIVPPGISIARGEVQISPLTPESDLLDFHALGIEKNPLSVTGIQVGVRGTSPLVTCVLTNSWQKPMTQPISVVAVAYGAGGELVGIGFANAYSVPANGQVDVEIGMTMAAGYDGTPDRIETFASVRSLSDFSLEP